MSVATTHPHAPPVLAPRPARRRDTSLPGGRVAGQLAGVDAGNAARRLRERLLSGAASSRDDQVDSGLDADLLVETALLSPQSVRVAHADAVRGPALRAAGAHAVVPWHLPPADVADGVARLVAASAPAGAT